MPTYCYVANDGEVREEIFSCGKAPTRITRKGKRYRRAIALEHAGFRDTPGIWPHRTVIDGVHPSQTQELRDYLSRKGVPTEVHSDGTVTWRDREHRRAYCEALGKVDLNAGYGDYAGS